MYGINEMLLGGVHSHRPMYAALVYCLGYFYYALASCIKNRWVYTQFMVENMKFNFDDNQMKLDNVREN
jgi:hypothetical protein